MRQIRAALLAAALGLAAPPAHALAPQDCTFYAPYDGGLDAAAARGSGEGRAEGAVEFVAGLRGQGILVGAPGSSLTYETQGNLDLEAGSVSVWVRPETWDDTDAAMRFFFSVTEADPTMPQDGGTFLSLYRYFARSTYFLVWDSRSFPSLSGQVAYAYDVPDAFRRGEWTHLVGTWNGDEICLYIDGRSQGAVRVPTRRVLRSLGERFSVGGANRANAADTVLDEFRLFDRALTAPEVEALHRHSLEAEPAVQELRVARLPGAQKVRVDINAVGRRPLEALGLSALLALTAADGGAPLQEQIVVFADAQHTVAEFGTDNLPPGDYRVTSTLGDNGTPLATSAAGFALRAPPEWLGSAVGLTDTVPEPWTNVQASGEGATARVECWGPRVYEVGDALFPRAMQTGGRELLASPISIEGVVNGAPLDTSKARTRWVMQTAQRAELTAEAAGNGVTVTTDSFVEYDGLVWVRLSLASDDPLKVDSLRLSIPLRRDVATLMQSGFDWRDAGAVRPWQHRAIANAQVWLGNEEGGLQCTVPSARNFRNADRNRQIEIVPEGDRVVLTLNLVDTPSSFDGRITYEIGLQLTPVRPYPQGWRRWRIAAPPGTPGTVFRPFYSEGWAVGTSYPIPKPEFESMFNAETAQGHIATLYLQPTSAWAGMPDYGDFAAEWYTKASSPPPPPDPQASPTSSVSVCARPRSWSDYFIGTLSSLMEGRNREMGWGAVYLDCAMLSPCDNPDHGCGYEDEYGVRQPEQRFLEHRDVQRRLYVAMQERWPGKLIFNHQSGQLNMMQLGFSHGLVDGEHLTDQLPTHHFRYYDILTLDRMRAEYMGRNFGFVPIFLPEFTRAGAGNVEVARRMMLTAEPPEVLHLVGLLLLHDILPWPAYSSTAPYVHLWAVQDAFGWDDDVEFLPYWRNADLLKVSPEDPNIVCSLYRRAGKLMAVVMNNTDEDRTVSLELVGAGPAQGELTDAWAAASFEPELWAIDDATGEPKRLPETARVEGRDVRVPVEAGRVAVEVGRRNFRVLVTN